MPRDRSLTIALAIAGVLVLAFAASFLFGLFDGGEGEDATTPADGADRIRVEVLNAAGTAGLARAATERLRREGFDVVYFGNAPAFGGDSSLVLDRVGRREQAVAVARALGVRNVRSEPDPDLRVDVSVILGRDWPGDAGAQPRGLRRLLPD